MTTAPRVPAGSSNCRAISGVTLFSVMPNPAPVSPARLAGIGLPVGFGVEVELVDPHVERALLAVAHHLDRHGRARVPWPPRAAGRSSLVFTGLPLNSTMTSPGSMPAVAAGPGGTCATTAPRRSFRLSASTSSGDTGRTDTPIRPARDLARAQARQHVADRVDGDREADADVARAAHRADRCCRSPC